MEPCSWRDSEKEGTPSPLVRGRETVRNSEMLVTSNLPNCSNQRRGPHETTTDATDANVTKPNVHPRTRRPKRTTQRAKLQDLLQIQVLRRVLNRQKGPSHTSIDNRLHRLDRCQLAVRSWRLKTLASVWPGGLATKPSKTGSEPQHA